MIVCKQFMFHAAHHIPHHQGHCQRPHGHTYRVDVAVEGDVQDDGPEAGMVIDFGDIKRCWENYIEPLVDHQDLNVTLEPYVRWTTAEEIAGWLLREFRTRLSGDVGVRNVLAVRVWETPTSYAETTS